MKIAVIGGGISGLTTAFLLGRKWPQAQVDVLEKDSAPGGTVSTCREDGFQMETGPNGFLSGKPTTLRIVEMLGASDRLIEANKAAEKRFILKKGNLTKLPDSPPAFFGSSILSLPAKIRIMKEPFVRKCAPDVEETVAEFGKRRLGPQAVTYMLDPMVSGVFAGNVDKLSLPACFPRIHELEQTYGSLVKAMFKLRSKKASPSGRLTSLVDGMGELVERLCASGNFTLRSGVEITGIERGPSRYKLDGVSEPYDIVVLAVPSYTLARMELDIPQPVRNDLEAIVYPPMAVVPFAVKKGVLDGFGFLIPSVEKRKILGGLFSSCIFPNRGTDDHDLVTVMMGGDRHHNVRDLSDADVVDIAVSEIAEILDISTTDLEQKGMFRWSRAIPQYYRGHPDVVKRVEDAVSGHPGLFVTGNAFYGVGINDCTRAAFETVDRVAQYLEETSG